MSVIAWMQYTILLTTLPLQMYTHYYLRLLPKLTLSDYSNLIQLSQEKMLLIGWEILLASLEQGARMLKIQELEI